MRHFFCLMSFYLFVKALPQVQYGKIARACGRESYCTAGWFIRTNCDGASWDHWTAVSTKGT